MAFLLFLFFLPQVAKDHTRSQCPSDSALAVASVAAAASKAGR